MPHQSCTPCSMSSAFWARLGVAATMITALQKRSCRVTVCREARLEKDERKQNQEDSQERYY